MSNYLTYNTYPQTHHNAPSRQAQAAATARQLYNDTRHRNWLTQIRLAFNKRSRTLMNLVTVEAKDTITSYHHIGRQVVSLSQIRGSSNTGRCQDFDSHFYPLQEHNKERWVNVATARLMGVKLPPVSLIQIGDIYFVQDGHHRVSVALALGQQEIEAEVTVGQVTESPSPQTQTTPAFATA